MNSTDFSFTTPLFEFGTRALTSGDLLSIGAILAAAAGVFGFVIKRRNVKRRRNGASGMGGPKQ